jgi:hypothetical protein
VRIFYAWKFIYVYENLFFGLIATGFVTLFFFSSVQEDIVTRDNLKQS